MKKSILTETKSRLEQITEKKAHELSITDSKLATLRAEMGELEKKQEQAAEDMNLSLYEELSDNIKSHLTAINMFTAKKKSLEKTTNIQPDESDRTIDGLLVYGQELSERFYDDISKPMAILEKIVNDYDADLNELRETISAWQKEIGLPYRGGTTPLVTRCGECILISELTRRMQELRRVKTH